VFNNYWHEARRARCEDRRMDRIWSRLDRSGRCWLWRGTRTLAGYGQVQICNQRLYLHRLVYEWVRGEIPEGHVIMHTCDTPACVNPAHLRVGTQSDNMQDAAQKGRMNNWMRDRVACKNGHPFEGRNVAIHYEGKYRIRRCRTCARVRMRERTRRLRAAQEQRDGVYFDRAKRQHARKAKLKGER
jgi:hypothetical protein